MQDLDERKRKILKAIIQTYLETGEPVGSRTISKYTDLNLSSATIRNEMSDLEDLGYIVQPHTSAGRIPSDLGYRLYVDELMKEKDQEVSGDEGNHDREDRPDGTGAQTGGQGACIQYELCDAHYRSYLSSQQSKVHSVIQAERRTASGGDRCGRQPGKEPDRESG